MPACFAARTCLQPRTLPAQSCEQALAASFNACLATEENLKRKAVEAAARRYERATRDLYTLSQVSIFAGVPVYHLVPSPLTIPDGHRTAAAALLAIVVLLAVAVAAFRE